MSTAMKKTKNVRRSHADRGFTLVELMIAMAIGLIVTLAVTTMIVVSQSHERVTTGANDMNQGGAFTASILDNSVRSAGAGFSQYWNQGVIGCRLNAERSGTHILPRSSALPAPFEKVMGGAGVSDLRLAPLLIAQGQSAGESDVLLVMSGLTNVGDVPRDIRSYSTADNKLFMKNTVSLHQGDVIVISREGTTDCIVTQVDGGASPFEDTPGQDTLPLGGTFFSEQSRDGNTSLTDLALNSSGRTKLSAIGNVNNVQLQAFGVGADQVLYRYDLLQSNDRDASEPVAEGVVAMRAVYGVASDLDQASSMPAPVWEAPADDFALDALIAQSPPERIRSIVAVRVSMLVRSSVRQPSLVADESYTLLADLPGASTVSLANSERHFAHRIFETTIPMRSMMVRLLPKGETQ